MITLPRTHPSQSHKCQRRRDQGVESFARTTSLPLAELRQHTNRERTYGEVVKTIFFVRKKTRENTFYKERIPKRTHSMENTFRREHILWRTHSVENTFYREHIS